MPKKAKVTCLNDYRPIALMSIAMTCFERRVMAHINNIIPGRPRRPASLSRLFTVDIETGILRVLFNEAASLGLVRHLFLKLDTLMYLSSCSVVHWGHPLLFLFWLGPVSLFCEGSSTQCCTRSSVSWQFLARNSLHFSEQE